MRALLSRLTLAASALFFLPWAHAQNADARKEIEAASQAALPPPSKARRSEARRPGRAQAARQHDVRAAPAGRPPDGGLWQRQGSQPAGRGAAKGDEDDWLITVNFEKTGYIKDDDARNWNVGELLDSLREGTKQSNVERVKRGFPSC